MALQTTARVRKWGNSYGVALPRVLAQEQRLKEGDEVDVIVMKKRTANDLWGILPGRGKSTQRIKNELRKELYDDALPLR